MHVGKYLSMPNPTLAVLRRNILASGTHGVQEGHLIMWLVVTQLPPPFGKNFPKGFCVRRDIQLCDANHSAMAAWLTARLVIDTLISSETAALGLPLFLPSNLCTSLPLPATLPPLSSSLARYVITKKMSSSAKPVMRLESTKNLDWYSAEMSNSCVWFNLIQFGYMYFVQICNTFQCGYYRDVANCSNSIFNSFESSTLRLCKMSSKYIHVYAEMEANKLGAMKTLRCRAGCSPVKQTPTHSLLFSNMHSNSFNWLL